MNIGAYIPGDPLVIGFIVLCISNIILLFVIWRLFARMRRFLVGFDSKHIGDSLSFVSENLKDLQAFRAELERYLTGVEKRLSRSLQSVHTLRYNPFHGQGGGGNQSFATAFLDEHGDGVVITGLYSRDRVSVFSKPVKEHSSEFELSEEERSAIADARSKLRGRQTDDE